MATTEAFAASLTPANTTDMHEDQPIILITPADFKQFSFVVNVILTTIICTVGVVGNSAGLYILSTDKNRKSITIYTYLIYLLSIDTMYLVLGLLLSAFYTTQYIDWEAGRILQKHTLLYRPYLDLFLTYVSTVLLIIMSFERLLALTNPFTVKQSLFNRFPGIISAASVGVCGILLIPFLISFHVSPFQNESNLTEYTLVVKSGFHDFLLGISFASAILLHYVAPVVVLFINILILITYSRFKKRRASVLGSSSLGQVKITIVIVMVSAMYILLSLPNVFIQTLMMADVNYAYYGKYKLTFLVFTYIGDLLARINAAADFFVYIFVCHNYRTMISTLFCKCFRNGGQSIHGNSVDSFNSPLSTSPVNSFSRK